MATLGKGHGYSILVLLFGIILYYTPLCIIPGQVFMCYSHGVNLWEDNSMATVCTVLKEF